VGSGEFDLKSTGIRFWAKLVYPDLGSDTL
jgi:hypothetical protein